MQGPVPSWLGSRAPSKAPWHLGLARGRAPCKALCHLGLARGHQARPHGTRCVSWLGSRAGTKQGPCHLGLARRHQARPCGTLAWLAGGHQERPCATLAWLAGTKQGLVAPWLGSRDDTKQGLVAPWLGSWAGTMQGPVPPCLSSRAGIMQGPVVHLACLGSACGHHARPRGTRHGMGGGTCHVSLVKRPSFYAFAKFLRDDMRWARGWGGSRPAEASKGRGDIADGWRGWFQTSGPGPGKGGSGCARWGGRDESERHRAESQWIVAARPLCHLQYPVAYLSRLQRILPAARSE